jgi:sec-independent protein translocase protein TatA
MFGGSGKISSIMGDVAKGIKSFKKGMAEDEEAQKDDTAHKDAPPKSIDGGPAKPAEPASVQANKVG